MTISADPTEMLYGPISVYIGTAGSTPSTYVGYNDDGAEITPSGAIEDVKVGDRGGAVDRRIPEPEMTVKFSLVQSVLANFTSFMPGGSTSGSVISFPRLAQTLAQISVRIIGLDTDGTSRVWECLYCTVSVGPVITLSPRTRVKIPVELKTLSLSTNVATLTDGGGDDLVTIASGVFARVTGLNYYSMAGEGAAADVLDNITGSFTNGELVTLSIQDITQPITVTHLLDTLELIGLTDWIMTKLGDRLYLEYQTVDTAFHELGRYDDPTE